MRIELTAAGRAELEAAVAAERRVRQWRRYRAVLLLAERAPEAVAASLGCSRSSVYGWAAAYRAGGLAGLRARPRPGRPTRLGVDGAGALERLLGEDPQARGRHATGWTVTLLRAELAATGRAVSARTIRRALRALGWRWKRPRYVLGRPDPAYAEERGASPTGRRPS